VVVAEERLVRAGRDRADLGGVAAPRLFQAIADDLAVGRQVARGTLVALVLAEDGDLERFGGPRCAGGEPDGQGGLQQTESDDARGDHLVAPFEVRGGRRSPDGIAHRTTRTPGAAASRRRHDEDLI
jgi:hypothetical protein